MQPDVMVIAAAPSNQPAAISNQTHCKKTASGVATINGSPRKPRG